ADCSAPGRNCVSHRRPEAPPKDAAAAEIAIRTGPTGLNNPETQKRRPPATYAGTVSSLLLFIESSSPPTSARNHRADWRASRKYTPPPNAAIVGRQISGDTVPLATSAQSPMFPTPEKRK